MKKILRNTAIAITILFALVGLGGTAFASSTYFNWNGSESYQNILVIIEDAADKYAESKNELSEVNRENEQLINDVKDKENTIVAEKQKNNDLKKENDNLKELSVEGDNELKQAETDMKDVEQKAKDLLNGME